ncbi:response regulator [Streptomyces erythrochromogenes]|uniref:response regulator n=1 Tax=Streptomyces erythrochromogenes TaxID=285574 RepID=UPI003429A6F5
MRPRDRSADLTPAPAGPPGQDPDVDLSRLVKRLERERRTRRQIEAISERTIAELLYRKQELELLKSIAEAANRAVRVEDALQVTVDKVCEYTGWSVGHALLLDRASGDLRSARVWHGAENERFGPFRQATEGMAFGPGTGLPGRALTSGGPQWSLDLLQDAAFPRRYVAHDAGLRAAFAFPVVTGDVVVGILEFFTVECPKPRDATLDLMVQIGTQLGRVIERQHASEDLGSARIAAESAARSKSAFLATMSHEIRTPMNAVIGMIELLRDSSLTPEQRSWVDIIGKSGESLLMIIDDILDFSKIDAGKLQIERRPFMLQDCIECALDLVASRAAEKSLETACLSDPDLPDTVVGDGMRLRQVLVNLLTNAVKFTDTGQVVLSAGPASHSSPSHGEMELLFSVDDTGIGIPADRMDSLFHEFSQVDSTTTRRYGGTGLGLAISKRLVEIMGGRMWVESEEGKGSTFHFTIKVEPVGNAAPLFDSLESTLLLGKRLLVVGGGVNREVILRYATSWGMTVRAAPSPSAALDWLLQGHAFDLAVLDMSMPGVSGTEYAKSIQRAHSGALPLIMLTSLAGGHRERDSGAETDGKSSTLLAKPVKVSKLHDAFVAALAGETFDRAEPLLQQETDVSPPQEGQNAVSILVVEDNPVNRKIALLLLEKLHYQADVAANGVEALAAMNAKAYDVVLMDVEMPEMDGLEASRQIRRRPDHQPFIIAMTANAMQGDREICLAAGMNDYVAKPVRLNALAAALARSAPHRSHDELNDADEGSSFDRTSVQELWNTMGDSTTGLIDAFLRDGPRLLRGLHSDDIREVRRAAHTLKSNGLSFGLTDLAEHASTLEKAMREGVALDDSMTLIAEVNSEYERGRIHLTDVKKELQGESQ